MSDALPQQHPAVVLRSHYVHLRTLLAIATIVVVGLTAAVVVLASDRADVAPVSQTAAPDRSTISIGTSRYDGGPEEGTRGSAPAPATPYNGPH